MKRLIVLFVFGVWIQAQAYAQIHAPEVSPPATLTQIIGLTEVKIEYSRPGLKGRKMFGGFFTMINFNRLRINDFKTKRLAVVSRRRSQGGF